MITTSSYIICDNSSVDMNSQDLIKRNSPLPTINISTEVHPINYQQLESKLVYININIRNPLTSMPLFRNYLDELTKAKISMISTKDLLNFYKVRTEEDIPCPRAKTANIEFSSNFESGNLQRVYQHKDNEYVLMLHEDYGNPKYTQWFYFSVRSRYQGKVRFHIVNVSKKDDGLMQGMQIVVRKGLVWERGGEDTVFREATEFYEYFDPTNMYALSFTYNFQDGCPVAFAYSFPYTHTQVTDWLRNISHANHDICQVIPLCKTLSGATCEMITITSEINLYTDLKKNQISEKKAVFFMGRVHPSESPSSYIIQGLVNFLIGKSFEARTLRKNFVFKIIPMINPDGVRYGNSRCSLLGIDLNRRWSEANEILHPEIYAAKELIKLTKEMHEVVMYCDIHSHAKKRNVFMYGCRVSNPDKAMKKKNMVARMIPMLLDKKNLNFSYKDSHFKMEKNKESTGRIVVYKEMGIVNSYTLETSFFGKDNGESFRIEDWEGVGADLASMCLNLVSPLAIKAGVRCALEWHKKQKSYKKKHNKPSKSKAKRFKAHKNSVEFQQEINESSSDDIDSQIDCEKLPQIQSPHKKLLKVASLSSVIKKEKPLNIIYQKKHKPGKSQRNVKGSLESVQSRKVLDTFPSLDIFVDKKKANELKTKLVMTAFKVKDPNEKLPAIKLGLA